MPVQGTGWLHSLGDAENWCVRAIRYSLFGSAIMSRTVQESIDKFIDPPLALRYGQTKEKQCQLFPNQTIEPAINRFSNRYKLVDKFPYNTGW